MKVTRQQFRDAMVIVENYYCQVKPNGDGKATHEIGCEVKLSSWGLEMQGMRKKKLRGTVIDFIRWANFSNDGCVTVKWDGIKKPDSMHISQIELI